MESSTGFCILTNRYGLVHDGWSAGASCICRRDLKIKRSTAGILLVEQEKDSVQHEIGLGEGRVIITGVQVKDFHIVCGWDVRWCVGGRVPADGKGAVAIGRS